MPKSRLLPYERVILFWEIAFFSKVSGAKRPQLTVREIFETPLEAPESSSVVIISHAVTKSFCANGPSYARACHTYTLSTSYLNRRLCLLLPHAIVFF